MKKKADMKAASPRNGAGGSNWPTQAWAAFDEAVAVLAGEPVALQWCSPAFAGWLGLPQAYQGMPLADVQQQLKGLADGWALALAEGGWSGAVAVAPLGRVTPGKKAPAAKKSPPAAMPAGKTAVASKTVSKAAASRRAHAGAVPAPAEAHRLYATLRPLGEEGGMALRLQPEPDMQRVTRRHLEDRERLLFTSRSVAVGEMATTLAHELNQPLGAVTNVLRGLKARIAAAIAQPRPGTMPTLGQGVQLALDQVQYASRIIGRIRDYTQSRQPRRERVDLHQLLHNSLTLMDWDLGRHGVKLSMNLAPGMEAGQGVLVAGDGVMLQQVMVNLLRNAIDAMADTPAGRRRLSIASRVDQAASQVEIDIADTGCGMDEEEAAQLFMPFYSSKPTGIGIGLNICRSLIELHQGRLWFTASKGAGCTFHVALPLMQGEDAQDLPRFLDDAEAALP